MTPNLDSEPPLLEFINLYGLILSGNSRIFCCQMQSSLYFFVVAVATGLKNLEQE